MSGLDAKIQVRGLKEFSRGLKKVDKEAPKQLRLALNGSVDFLISKARPKIPTRTGAARASLRARSSRTEARISAGGPRAPYYAWLDFGGRTGRRRSVRRPFIKGGRYLFPTLAEHRDEFQRRAEQAMTQVARDAGVEVS